MNALSRIPRPSPAMVVALAALVAACAGGATAAVVTTAQLGRSSVTGAHVRNSSLTGADVRNRSLTRRDFRGSVRGPAGPPGPAGPAGPPGAEGPPGPATGAAGGDLAGSYPNPAIAGNAVDGSRVRDGSLSLADLAVHSGSGDVDPPSLPGNTCDEASITPGAAATLAGDVTLIVPGTIPDGFFVDGQRVGTPGTFRYRVCNTTDVTVNAGPISITWFVLRP